MSTGRPSKYDPRFCQMLIEHMAKGFPYETFAGVEGVDVNRDTLYAWEKEHKAFSDAKKLGRSKQYLQLMSMGMAGATGGIRVSSGKKTKTTTKKVRGQDVTTTETMEQTVNGFNSTAWIFMMKNMAGWKDQPDFNEDDLVDSMSFGEDEDEAS